MTNSVVADSTCLIGLERIEHLDILPALFEPILIPPAVQQEFGISLPWLLESDWRSDRFYFLRDLLVD